MRALVQRVSSATVRVEGRTVAAIGPGLLVLLGVADGDDEATAASVATRVGGLRIFEDEAGKMNRAVGEARGEVLCVSQFTLYGNVRRGRRPSFEAAAEPALAERLYEAFCTAIESQGLRCARGVFRARMEVASVNDGPVTLMVDSADLARPRR